MLCGLLWNSNLWGHIALAILVYILQTNFIHIHFTKDCIFMWKGKKHLILKGMLQAIHVVLVRVSFSFRLHLWDHLRKIPSRGGWSPIFIIWFWHLVFGPGFPLRCLFNPAFSLPFSPICSANGTKNKIGVVFLSNCDCYFLMR